MDPARPGDRVEMSEPARRLRALLERMPEGAPEAVRLLDGAGIWSIVDRFLDLGPRSGPRFFDLSRQETAEALKVLADLLRQGVVGYEYREVNGEPRKVFLSVAIGSDLHRAPLLRDGRVDGFL